MLRHHDRTLHFIHTPKPLTRSTGLGHGPLRSAKRHRRAGPVVNRQRPAARGGHSQPRGEDRRRAQTPANRALSERREQRLPDHVDDHNALARVALLLRARRE